MLKLQLKFKDKILSTVESAKSEIIVGRSKGADIQIDNLAVSKEHARIITRQGRYSLEDLNSTNGTYVNNEKVARAMLKDGDVITIGKHAITVSIPKAEGRPSAGDFADDTVKVMPKTV
jgi:pSer/pThr/pTyr-binding forkhead associated (FHA) protein